MKCIICGKTFESIWKHLTGREEGLFVLKDEDHREYYKKVEGSRYELPCFCGGKISISSYSPDSWEVMCDKCGFLWDED